MALCTQDHCHHQGYVPRLRSKALPDSLSGLVSLCIWLGPAALFSRPLCPQEEVLTLRRRDCRSSDRAHCSRTPSKVSMYQEPLFLSLQETKPAGSGERLNSALEQRGTGFGRVCMLWPDPGWLAGPWQGRPHLPGSPLPFTLNAVAPFSQHGNEGSEKSGVSRKMKGARHCLREMPAPSLVDSARNLHASLKPCLLHPEGGPGRGEGPAEDPTGCA